MKRATLMLVEHMIDGSRRPLYHLETPLDASSFEDGVDSVSKLIKQVLSKTRINVSVSVSVALSDYPGVAEIVAEKANEDVEFKQWLEWDDFRTKLFQAHLAAKVKAKGYAPNEDAYGVYEAEWACSLGLTPDIVKDFAIREALRAATTTPR